MLGVLLERRQFREGVLAHEEALQGGVCLLVQPVLDEVFQTSAFRREHLADDALQRSVARAHDAPGGQKGQQLRQDEGRGHVPLRQKAGPADDRRPVRVRPEPIAKQPGDLPALGVMLVGADRLRRQRASRKVAFHQEGDVAGRNVGPGEAEEGLLGLEIPDLPQAPDLFRQPLAPVDQSAFSGVQGEELGPLEVVEVG